MEKPLFHSQYYQAQSNFQSFPNYNVDKEEQPPVVRKRSRSKSQLDVEEDTTWTLQSSLPFVPILTSVLIVVTLFVCYITSAELDRIPYFVPTTEDDGLESLERSFFTVGMAVSSFFMILTMTLKYMQNKSEFDKILNYGLAGRLKRINRYASAVGAIGTVFLILAASFEDEIPSFIFGITFYSCMTAHFGAMTAIQLYLKAVLRRIRALLCFFMISCYFGILGFSLARFADDSKDLYRTGAAVFEFVYVLVFAIYWFTYRRDFTKLTIVLGVDSEKDDPNAADNEKVSLPVRQKSNYETIDPN